MLDEISEREGLFNQVSFSMNDVFNTVWEETEGIIYNSNNPEHNRLYKDCVDSILEGFDANYGLNWDTLFEMLQDIDINDYELR